MIIVKKDTGIILGFLAVIGAVIAFLGYKWATGNGSGSPGSGSSGSSQGSGSSSSGSGSSGGSGSYQNLDVLAGLAALYGVDKANVTSISVSSDGSTYTIHYKDGHTVSVPNPDYASGETYTVEVDASTPFDRNAGAGASPTITNWGGLPGFDGQFKGPSGQTMTGTMWSWCKLMGGSAEDPLGQAWYKSYAAARGIQVDWTIKYRWINATSAGPAHGSDAGAQTKQNADGTITVTLSNGTQYVYTPPAAAADQATTNFGTIVYTKIANPSSSVTTAPTNKVATDGHTGGTPRTAVTSSNIKQKYIDGSGSSAQWAVVLSDGTVVLQSQMTQAEIDIMNAWSPSNMAQSGTVAPTPTPGASQTPNATQITTAAGPGAYNTTTGVIYHTTGR